MIGTYFIQSCVLWQLYFHLLTVLSMLQALCSDVNSLEVRVVEASYYCSDSMACSLCGGLLYLLTS